MQLAETARDTLDIMHYAWHGDMPVIGSLDEADAVIGFSFGVHYDNEGGIADPGMTNRQLARYLLNSEALRDKEMPWFLQEEIAIAIEQEDSSASWRIVNLGSLKHPFKNYNTDELICANANQFATEQATTVVDLSHPYHMARTAANLYGRGLYPVTLDTYGEVDFDPVSSQRWTRDPWSWRKREMLAIGLFAAKGALKLPPEARR